MWLWSVLATFCYQEHGQTEAVTWVASCSQAYVGHIAYALYNLFVTQALHMGHSMMHATTELWPSSWVVVHKYQGMDLHHADFVELCKLQA